MRTVNEIAKILKVKPNAAYGLLHFMREKGFIVEGKAKRAPGKKGKAAATYSFDHTSIEQLTKELSLLVDADRKVFVESTKANLAAPVNPAPEVVS